MFRVLLLATLAHLCMCQDYDDVPDFGWDDLTALDEYVHRDDGYWSYTLLEKIERPQVDIYVLNMTSQKWMDESYASRSVWWHWVGISVPHELRSTEHAIMAIVGGNNRNPDDPPGEGDPDNILTSVVANDTGVVTAYIKMNPNQPIVFTNDPEQKSRSEDDVIAWTWRTYLDEPEIPQEVILRCPMTKGAKRGMDTIADFLSTIDPELNINKFFIGGGSKRGWTTWSLAAVDDRVAGIAPLVFSLLNIDEGIMAHYQALAGWSFAFGPYWRANLTLELHNPRTQDIWDIEDVFRYRSRYDGMEKYLISATGDEFFLNHDTHYWWTGMPGPMRHYMVANAEHTLAPHYLKIYDCICSFVISIIEGLSIPSTSWDMYEDEDMGYTRYYTDTEPSLDEEGNYQATAWRAVTLDNDTRRDFRLVAGYPDAVPHPVRWYEEAVVVEEADDDEYQFYHETDTVEDEWVGQVVEVIYDGPEDHRWYFTSQANIIPDTFPVGPCQGAECYGELV